MRSPAACLSRTKSYVSPYNQPRTHTLTLRKRHRLRDRFVTRLIPLRYIDAESIVNTLKPLVSKDA